VNFGEGEGPVGEFTSVGAEGGAVGLEAEGEEEENDDMLGFMVKILQKKSHFALLHFDFDFL